MDSFKLAALEEPLTTFIMQEARSSKPDSVEHYPMYYEKNSIVKTLKNLYMLYQKSKGI